MKQSLIILGVSLVVIVGGFFGYQKVLRPLLVKQHAALSVTVPFEGTATVFLDGKKLGVTPFYSEEVAVGEATLLLSSDTATFERRLTFTPGTQTVVNWDLGPSDNFQAGDVIWLEESALGTRVAIISEPSEADVAVDGAAVGKTPFSSGEITPGEHRLEISKEGWETRTLRVRVLEGYKLNLSSRLFLKPLIEKPQELSTKDAAVKILDLSSTTTTLNSNPAAWAKGLVYWIGTRYQGRAEQPEFDYFVDWKGKVYDRRGVPFSNLSETKVESGQIGYLGRGGEEGLTEAAQKSLAELLSTAPSLGLGSTQVEILETGLGWLRVHADPSSGTANEVARVNVGEKYPLVGEQPGWYQIQLEDGTQGWIAASYGKKVEGKEGIEGKEGTEETEGGEGGEEGAG